VYGVGTTITNAPVVDFSMDIIEVDGQAVAKGGGTLSPVFLSTAPGAVPTEAFPDQGIRFTTIE
jgi:nicotinic acid phosphoribosyltransferase